MFDDCKGEKFLELLAAFSNLVLRKVVAEGEEGRGSIAQRLCSAEKISPNERKSYLPLAIAHRVALRGILKKKNELRARHQDFGRILDEKEKELDRRLEKVVETQAFLDKNIAAEAAVSRVTRQFSKHWQGDGQCIDVISQGEGSATTDALLDGPFSEIWLEVNQDSFKGDASTHQYGLLEDLEKRVEIQNERVQRWKDFKSEMQKRAKPAPPLKKADILSTNGKTILSDLRKEEELVFSPRKSPCKS